MKIYIANLCQPAEYRIIIIILIYYKPLTIFGLVLLYLSNAAWKCLLLISQWGIFPGASLRSIQVAPGNHVSLCLSLIHISEPTRRTPISYAVFCLKKKKK